MPILFASILGIVQAATEFLPVSSSGHLVLFQVYLKNVFDAPPTDLSFDVLIHVATLLVTVIYLRADILELARGLLPGGEQGVRARRLVLLLIVATMPAAIVGLGLESQIEMLFHSASTVSVGFLFTALLLFAAHFKQRSHLAGPNDEEEVDAKPLEWHFPSVWMAFVIGCAQALAITPGVSRSGATIAAALVLGLPAVSALRFSFLMSLPAIAGAMLLQFDELRTIAGDQVNGYIAGFVTAFIVGWIALRLLVLVTKKTLLIYFGLYTLILGLLLQVV